MIYFIADDHYGARPGATLHRELGARFPLVLFENDVSCLAEPGFPENCELLVLNMISGTGDLKPAGPDAERGVRGYLERGKPLLLLHGASAAFWQWDWWRRIVGFRWVRGNDPDGVRPSRHPVHPYRVDVAKTRHALCGRLKTMSLPEDEIFIELEQTCPVSVLLETTIEEGTFPQCWECSTPWGGRVIGFLPGHRSEAVRNAAMVENAATLIDTLLQR